jgi:hypothetical protein
MIKLQYISEKIALAKYKKTLQQLIDDYPNLVFLYNECDKLLDNLNEFYEGKA